MTNREEDSGDAPNMFLEEMTDDITGKESQTMFFRYSNRIKKRNDECVTFY